MAMTQGDTYRILYQHGIVFDDIGKASSKEIGEQFARRAKQAAPRVRSGAKRAKQRWDKLSPKAKAGIAAGAGVAALAGATYAIGSSRGSSIPSGGMQSRAEKELAGFQRMAEARVGDPRYKPVGGNVFHRSRKLFRGTAAAGAAQLARSNEGGGPIYAHSKYPRLLLGGMTYPTSPGTPAAMDLRPAAIPTKWAKTKAGYFAAHEREHAATLNAETARRQVRESVEEAMAKHPKTGSRAREFLTGKGFARQMALGSGMQRRTGHVEALADLAAHRDTGVDPRLISGYPARAAAGSDFGAGYHGAGGPKAPANAVEQAAQRKELRAAWKKGLSGALRLKFGKSDSYTLAELGEINKAWMARL